MSEINETIQEQLGERGGNKSEALSLVLPADCIHRYWVFTD
jgi:hypothetical protein